MATSRSEVHSADWLGWKALCGKDESSLAILLAEQEAPPPPPPHVGCVHKPLLEPHLTVIDTGAMGFVFVIAALALASGIGGGGIYVPMLNLLLRFRPHVAVGLSQALIFGGSLGALVVNVQERHPASHTRPLIDYGLAAFLSPAEMAGAQLGVILNQALPSPVILITMACLLSVLAVRTLRKGADALAKERRAAYTQPEGTEEGRLLQAPSAASAPPTVAQPQASPCTPPPSPPPPPSTLSQRSPSLPAPPPLTPPCSPPCSPPSNVKLSSLAIAINASPPASPSETGALSPLGSPATSGFGPLRFLLMPLARLLSDRAPGTHAHVPIPSGVSESASKAESGVPTPTRSVAPPLFETALLGVVWLGLLAVLVLRGRKGAPSLLGLKPCGMGYWGITVVGFLWLLAISIVGGRRLVRNGRRKRSSEYLQGDVRWDGVRAARCLLQALLAGVMAGLVGVGGGMVLGPMMLELGVLPQVCAACHYPAAACHYPAAACYTMLLLL